MDSRNPDLPWFYPDKVSASAGDTVAIHASGPASLCTLSVTRIGTSKDELATFDDIDISKHALPERPDKYGCDWPQVFSFEVSKQWPTGYYDLCLKDEEGRETHHFICVKTSATDKADAAIILSTNTYSAYNYWGGSNAYAGVEAFKKGDVDDFTSREGAISSLSRLRPYPQNMINSPDGMPRVLNKENRPPNEMAIPTDVDWALEHELATYDVSAGFINKWEHKFVSWLEQNGFDIDYLCDHDFDGKEGDLLSTYNCVLIVGHSEYWSRHQREALDTYVDQGGNLAIFSGNTCYWKVRWEDNGTTMACHKTKGHINDPLWADKATRADATHIWSHPELGNPEARLTGLSFLYGGYHRVGMCVSRGASAYTIYNDEHWALEGADLHYGDLLGADVQLLAYENDGCLIQFDDNGLPVVAGGTGVPKSFEIIGIAPTCLFETEHSPFPALIPREEPELLAQVAYGKVDNKTIDRLARGHAVMGSFKRGKGEVFNAGTTEWGHGIGAGDPYIDRITKNVLNRFGLKKSGQNS